MNFEDENFLNWGACLYLARAMTINFGTKAFATPTGAPFDPVRFAVITDSHIDIKEKTV